MATRNNSKLDFSIGYYLTPVESEFIEKAAFYSNFGKFDLE